MGFWHTGYIEFHEPSGLGEFSYRSSSPEFPCAHCGETYGSLDALRKHRFETHPLRRPTMFLKGCELGSQPVHVTSKLSSDDIALDDCDRATINGRQISVSDLPRDLAEMKDGVCRALLSKAGVDAEFVFDFRVASEEDLAGVERELRRTAERRRLDRRAIDEFISATAGFNTAIGYVDGICAYLYGVLAKERAADSSLPYELYSSKFSKAVDELEPYDRPYARTIASLVEFHFNHFVGAARLVPFTRVGRVAATFAGWIGADGETDLELPPVAETLNNTDTMFTDWVTEEIFRWAIRPQRDLVGSVVDIEAALHRDIADYDRAKLRVLLTEIYAHSGAIDRAQQYARALRNLRPFEEWAESVIKDASGGRS